MHAAFDRIDHRPWGLPKSPWIWRQSWRDLLFAHWSISARELRPLVPPALTIQEFEGTSWIGIVPLLMAGVMRRPLPDLPGLSRFPELNLRLYVEYEGKPGVWFLSLDATNPIAVWAARRFFYLPYVRARIAIKRVSPGFIHQSERLRGDSRARFSAQYEPTSEPHETRPGTLEHFLTERYCLYSQSPKGELYRAEVHHAPWPLQSASAEFEANELPEAHGLKLDRKPDLLHFSSRLDVVVWPPEKVRLGGDPR